MTAGTPGTRRRVRIWFGDLLVAEYIADPDRASRYQRVMEPTFNGLRITVEVVPKELAAAELPDEQLWPLTVK